MDEDREHGLVMPFVVCASKGGPYDDLAFGAGYHAGQISSHLEDVAPAEYEVTVRTAMVEQVDLIAMRFGYQMEVVEPESGADYWSFVRLTKTTG